MASEKKRTDAASTGAYCELADGRILMFPFLHVEVEICTLPCEKIGLLLAIGRLQRINLVVWNKPLHPQQFRGS